MVGNLGQYTISTVVAGGSYQFRFRMLNSIGYGEWSPLVTIRAVSVPSQVAAPVVAEQAEGQITYTSDYSYVGCYNDDADRAINDHYIGFEQTITSCAQ